LDGLSRRWGLLISALILAALVLAGCGGASSNKPVDVTINLSEFKIDASMTEFKVGVPYHFTVKNNGTLAHEFQIMPPKSGEVSQDEVDQLSLAGIPQSQLAVGQTATLDYTFTQPYSAGELEFACHIPGHYEAGMHVPITVTQ
jgi:uncharacterized cupredoxin-like copper-binding protein